MYAREPGGAELLALLAKYRPEVPVRICARDYACDVFTRHGLEFTKFTGTSRSELGNCLAGFYPKSNSTVLVTSAAGLPEQDMTERYVWLWAREAGIPSVAILDQWQNYAQRFSGPNGTEPLAYQPDMICVMDQHAATALTGIGITDDHIVVTGQPSLARLRRAMKATVSADRSFSICSALNISPNEKVLLFISEPFLSSHGNSLGLTEASILEEILRYCRMRRDAQRPVRLLIKLHPKNSGMEFNQVLAKFSDMPAPILLRNEVDKETLLSAADVVVGMASIMLMESVALGRPTVSVQIGAYDKSLCRAVNLGLIPCVDSSDVLYEVLNDILDTTDYAKAYLGRIREENIITNAEERIWDVIDDFAGKKEIK